MDMQDKEFDKLFNSKLGGLEIEPSAHVWKEINSELNGNKGKKQFVQYLSIAAGVILLITAGLLFIPKPAKVHILKATNTMAKNTKSVKSTPAPEVVTEPKTTLQNKKNILTVIAPVNSMANVHKVKKQRPVIPAAPDAVVKGNTDDIVRPENQPALASATESHNIIAPVVPDGTTRLKPVIMENTYVADKPVMAQNVPVKEKQATAPVKKRKIRSFGDLLNVAIAAVDKRKDKIIEFSNTDEEDATITGVNLGIIKVKKEK